MSVHETVDIVMAVMVVVVFVLVCISPRTHACLAHTIVVIVKVCIYMHAEGVRDICLTPRRPIETFRALSKNVTL